MFPFYVTLIWRFLYIGISTLTTDCAHAILILRTYAIYSSNKILLAIMLALYFVCSLFLVNNPLMDMLRQIRLLSSVLMLAYGQQASMLALCITSNCVSGFLVLSLQYVMIIANMKIRHLISQMHSAMGGLAQQTSSWLLR